MPDDPLSDKDERAVQLMVGRIVGKSATVLMPRACRDGDTIPARDADETALAECIACGMFVRADQVGHAAFGFKARCTETGKD